MTAESNRQTEHHPQTETQATDTVNVQAASKIETQPVQSAPVVIKQNSGGKGMAAGALVLSVLSLGASGLLFVQGQNVLKTQELQLQQELQKAALGESSNAALLNNAIGTQQQLRQNLAELQSNQNQTKQNIDNINRAYAELLKDRADWVVSEIEISLNLASQQLLLAGNIPFAAGILENAEQRLNRFDQAALLPVKQAISQDLAALKSRSYLNISATAMRLDRLENTLSGLPLIPDAVLKTGDSTPEPTSAAGSLWDKAWDNTVSMFKSMVEVRRVNSSDTLLLAPDQLYFVKENLRLRLLNARLALFQYNNDSYQSDLDAIETAVKQYFDTQSPSTQAWLQELSELKALEIRMVSDDALSGSLNAILNYQSATRPSTAATPQPSESSSPATTAPPSSPEASTSAKPDAEASGSESNDASEPASTQKGAAA